MTAEGGTNAGYVGPGDIATLSLLGRGYGGLGGYGGHGYGYGDQVLAAGAHADGTAVAAKIDTTGEKVAAQTSLFDQAERSRQATAIRDDIDTVRSQMVADAKDQAKCCCDSQLAAEKNRSELLAEIKAVEARGITRELDRCERRLESSDSTSTIVAAIQAQGQMLAAVLGHKAV